MEQIKDRTLDVSLIGSRGFVSGCTLKATPGKPQSRIEDRDSGAEGVLDGGIFPSPAPLHGLPELFPGAFFITEVEPEAMYVLVFNFIDPACSMLAK